MTETFKTMLLTYLKPNYVHQTHLSDIDPNNVSQFLSSHDIYLGVRVAENVSRLTPDEKIDFFIRCRQFLIVSCNEIKKRFDFKENILSQIAIFDNKHNKEKPQSILGVMNSLPRIINKNDTEKKQKVDDQWRLYCQLIHDFDEDIKNESLVDKYWHKIMVLTDHSGQNSFRELGEFVLDILATPHSNASCERVFSKVNLIKTNIRNRICTNSINGLLLASQSTNGECYKFKITDSLVQAMEAKNLYKSDDEEDVEIYFPT